MWETEREAVISNKYSSLGLRSRSNTEIYQFH